MGRKLATPMVGLKELRDAIPKKCFERSLQTSSLYVLRDLSAIGILAMTAIWLNDCQFVWRYPLWFIYGFVQGLFFTGVWILAHECGHDAFSSYRLLNSTIGYLLHSALLVPFFSWKFSHSRHHQHVNNMEKDTVFVPDRKGETKSAFSSLLSSHGKEDVPILSFFALILHQLLGWPAYIFLNAGAGIKSLVRGDRNTSPCREIHLDPSSCLFTNRERPYVWISNAGLLLMLIVLGYSAKSLGVYNTFALYGLPYVWMNHWIVAITYLHHTHQEAPHFEQHSWTFLNGALSTVDRDFGFIGRHIFHGIIEHHVVHHLFPRIPFYHAAEATSAIAPLLGDRYLKQPTSFLGALWSTYNSCRYVEERAEDEPGFMYWAI